MNDVFVDSADYRFPVSDSGSRREYFMNYLRSFSNMYTCIRVVYPDGINSLLNVSFFLVYNLMCMLNRRRGGFLDDDLVRRNVLLVLNECATNQFDLLYELIFD